MMATKDGRFNMLSSRRGCQLLLTIVILLSSSVQVGNAHADAECPVNWIEYDNFCYWVQDQVARTYADAQADCNGRGAALTSINSATEQNFIFMNLVAGAAVNIIWIGLNDMANEGTFVWEDGNTFGYTAWSPGQPDNFGNEDCVQLYNTGLWNDLGCTATNGYICKMKRTHFWIESAQYIGKEGSTLSVTVHREGLIANDDEVRIIAADVSAIRNTDYTTTRVRDVSFPSGTESVTITYDLDSDELIEDMESFTLSLILTGTTAAGTTAGVTATLDSPSTSTVFIVDCTAVFWIEEAEYIDKESGTVTVTVHREGNMANTDTITLTAADVTATLGVDYQTPSGTNTETVTFAAGDTSATVDYTLSTDTEVEDLETFTVTLALSGATDTNDFATIISPTITTVKIEDCTATFWIEEEFYFRKEDVDLIVTVHRDGNLLNTDEVVLTATDDTATYITDYTSPTGMAETLNFAVGDTSASVTYTIEPDTLVEGIETFTLDLTLSGNTDTDGFATVVEPSSSLVYIMDCTAVFWIEEDQYIAKEDTDLVVTVHRQGNLANTDTITLTVTDVTAIRDTDYMTPSGTTVETVTFATGDTTATVTYPISADTLIEDIETFTIDLALSGATNTDNFAIAGSPSMSTVYILDCTAKFWIEEFQYIVKEDTDLVVTIHREGNLAKADTLTLTSADVTAVLTTDYQSPSGTAVENINFAAGETTTTVTYPIDADTLTEIMETFTLTLALTGNTDTDMFATLYSPSVSTVFIIDCTAVFWIEQAVYTVKEYFPDTTLVVTIHREGNLANTDEITLTATDVTATYGVDYTSPFGAAETLTFAAGDSTASVTYTIDSDTLDEDIEAYTLDLALSGATMIDMFARLGSPSMSTVNIVDCTAVFWIEEVEYSTKEDRMLIVTVHREGNLANADEVELTATDVTAVFGTDYASPNGATETISFAAGDTTASVTYTIDSDNLIEDIETFTLDLALSGVTATDMFATVREPDSTTVSITDCTAVFWIEEVIYMAKEGVNLLVTVHRDGNLGDTDQITLTSTDGTATLGVDFSSPSGNAIETVNFAIGDTSATVTYTISSDTVIEDLETFTLDLVLAGTSAADNFATVISPSSSTVYIMDCTAVFWIEEAQYIGKENVNLVVTVHREGNLPNADTATLTTTDGTAMYGIDYSSPSGTNTDTLSFAAGVTTATVTYSILSDTAIEDVESFTLALALSGTTVTNMFASVTAPSSSTVYITDCTAVFWIEEATYSAKESVNLVVTIHREGNRASTDQLTLTANDVSALYGTDYSSPSITATEPVNFAAGDSAVTVTYTIIQDVLIEDTETFTLDLALTGTTLTNMFATIISPSTSTVYINDCTALFWIEEVQYAAKENTNLVITIHRVGNLVNTDQVTLTATDVTALLGTDYSSPSGTAIATINFASGDVTATATYAIASDTNIEDIETFTLTLALSGTTVTNMFATVTFPSTTTVYILDCTAVFWIEEVFYIGKENTNLVVTVHRDGNLVNTDDITLSSTDGSAVLGTDFSSPSGTTTETVTFAVGDTTATVTYPISIDTLIEDWETFTLNLALSGTTATNMFATVDLPSTSSVFILDCTSYFWIEEKQYIVFEETTLDLTFHRGGYLGRSDSITVSYTDARATNPADYTPVGDSVISFNAGETTSTKSVTINADNTLEYNEMFDVGISIPVDGTQLSQMATLYSPLVSEVIIKDPTWYVFDFAVYTIGESSGTITVTIERKGDLRTDGHVFLATRDRTTPWDLTASSPDDFTAVDMQVDFAADSPLATLDIDIISDSINEGQEEFQVYLYDPDTAEALGDLDKAIVIIYDDDIPAYQFEKGVYHVTESGGSVTLRILRVGPLVNEIAGTVELTTLGAADNRLLTAEDGTDFIGVTNEVIDFQAGDTTASYTISLANGVDVSKQEYFEVCLSDPTFGYVDPPECSIVYIEDDDSVYGFDKPIYHVKEDSAVTVSIVRYGCLNVAGSVEVSTTNITATEGVDYNRITNQFIAFAVGESAQSLTVLTLSRDARIERDERFELCLSNPMQGVLGLYGLIRCADVIIEDCDSEVAFGDASYTVIEGTQTISIKVIRRGYRGNIVSVDVVSSQITATEGLTYDYPPVAHTVVFGANDDPEETMVTFDIQVRDDLVVENMEYFELVLTNAAGCLIGEPNVAQVTVADNDVSYSIERQAYSLMESDGEALINVMRHGYLAQESEIGIYTRDITARSTSPNQDYEPISSTSTVTFEPDEYFKQVSISILDDPFFEVNEEFEVLLTSDNAEELSPPNAAVVTIRNDDIDCAIDCFNGFCVGPEECQCTEGYAGVSCGEDINECEIQPPVCSGDSIICLNNVGSYQCICTNPELVVVGNACVPDTRDINGQLYATSYGGQPIQFVDEMYDVNSEEFQFWANTIEPQLRNAVEGIDGFQDVSTTRLFPTEDGSLGIEYDVTVASSSPADETTVDALIASNITPEGYLGSSVVMIRPPPGFSSQDVDGVFYAEDVNGEPFDPVIFDTSSAAFEAFREVVEANLAQEFESLEGFEGVEVTGVFPVGDDIGVEYEVTSASDLSVSDLNDFLLASVGEGGVLGNTDLRLIPLADSCPAGFCENGGVCKILSDLTYGCICDSTFGGNRCEQNTATGESSVETGGLSRAAKIALGMGSAIFLLIALLITLCMYNTRLAQRRAKSAILNNTNPRIGLAPPIGDYSGISPGFPSITNM